MQTMKTIRFGIEIETMGQTRETVCKAIQTVVGGTVRYDGRQYDAWHCIDARGRTWKAVTDASIAAAYNLQAEIVSPILNYDDLEDLQNIVRAVRKAGAKTDASCGIHIHVDAALFTATTLSHLVKIVNKQERLIEHALHISDARKARWCKGVDQTFLGKLERSKPADLDTMNRLWYGYENPNPSHYDQTRYHGLNLHNVWFRGTVEFRWFESTLHAGEVKANIQFILALAAKALDAKSASSKRRDFNAATAKYDFRVLLLGLGLIGDEFKTCRLHMMKGLEGNAAWKHGTPTTSHAIAAN